MVPQPQARARRLPGPQSAPWSGRRPPSELRLTRPAASTCVRLLNTEARLSSCASVGSHPTRTRYDPSDPGIPYPPTTLPRTLSTAACRSAWVAVSVKSTTRVRLSEPRPERVYEESSFTQSGTVSGASAGTGFSTTRIPSKANATFQRAPAGEHRVGPHRRWIARLPGADDLNRLGREDDPDRQLHRAGRAVEDPHGNVHFVIVPGGVGRRAPRDEREAGAAGGPAGKLHDRRQLEVPAQRHVEHPAGRASQTDGDELAQDCGYHERSFSLPVSEADHLRSALNVVRVRRGAAGSALWSLAARWCWVLFLDGRVQSGEAKSGANPAISPSPPES